MQHFKMRKSARDNSISLTFTRLQALALKKALEHYQSSPPVVTLDLGDQLMMQADEFVKDIVATLAQGLPCCPVESTMLNGAVVRCTLAPDHSEVYHRDPSGVMWFPPGVELIGSETMPQQKPKQMPKRKSKRAPALRANIE